MRMYIRIYIASNSANINLLSPPKRVGELYVYHVGIPWKLYGKYGRNMRYKGTCDFNLNLSKYSILDSKTNKEELNSFARLFLNSHRYLITTQECARNAAYGYVS